jgi:hypothetical protein
MVSQTIFTNTVCPINTSHESNSARIIFTAIITQFYSPTPQTPAMIAQFVTTLNTMSKEAMGVAVDSKSKKLIQETKDVVRIAQTFGKTVETVTSHNNFVKTEIVIVLKKQLEDLSDLIKRVREESDLFKKIVASKTSTITLAQSLITMIEKTIHALQLNDHEVYKIITITLPRILETITKYTLNNEKIDLIVKSQWERFIMLLNEYTQVHDNELMQYVNDAEIIVRETMTRIDQSDQETQKLLANTIALYKRIVATNNQLNHYKNNQTNAYTFVRFTTIKVMTMLKAIIDTLKKQQ